MIPPLKILPNKRKDNEIGFASSPVIFKGNKNGKSPRYVSYKYPPIPFALIPDPIMTTIVITAKANVTL